MESVPGIFHDKLEEGRKALERTEWTQAKECFESVVCKEELPEAFELLGRSAWWLDEAATASMSGEISDLAVGVDICCYLITACEWVQDYSRAVQWCYNVKRKTSDGKYPLMFSLCQIHYTSVLIWRGEWDEAEKLLKEATDNLLVSRPAHAAQGLVRRADLFRLRGKYNEAVQLLKQVEKKLFRALGANYHLLAKASLAFDRGQLETAENLAERFLRNTPEKSRLMIPVGLRLLNLIQVELGHFEAASETAARLRSIADVAGTEPIKAAANLAEGNVLMSTGKYEDACRKFERAVELYRMSGNPYETARARNDLALVLYHLDKKYAAEKVAASALETFRELGALPGQKQSESILKKIKSRLQDHSDKSHPDAFTDRELEILCEIARGKSNPEIASDHFISVRTVERHISNIYSKLGASGRAARATATAYAHKNGLLD